MLTKRRRQRKQQKNNKKTIGLISKQNNFAHEVHFFVHFFAVVLHDDKVKLPETS